MTEDFSSGACGDPGSLRPPHNAPRFLPVKPLRYFSGPRRQRPQPYPRGTRSNAGTPNEMSKAVCEEGSATETRPCSTGAPTLPRAGVSITTTTPTTTWWERGEEGERGEPLTFCRVETPLEQGVTGKVFARSGSGDKNSHSGGPGERRRKRKETG